MAGEIEAFIRENDHILKTKEWSRGRSADV